MRTVVVTDGKYRAAVAAVRVLGRAGYRVVVTQTRGDTHTLPPAFASRYASEKRWLDGTVSGEGYVEQLLDLLGEYSRPALLCAGAATLNAVSWQRERFREKSGFLIPPPQTLDALNDKEAVHRRCQELGLPVPRMVEGVPDRYPVIVKPRCGERFGLKAGDRYRIARDEPSWRAAVGSMAAYDPSPLVQEMVQGDGCGASVLLGRQGELLCALCHRRVREYPVTGGPSSCCESVYDEEKVRQAHILLRSFGFQGLAMVEFKGPYILEVNPRIWGSFPLTEKADSPMALRYVQAALSEEADGGDAPQEWDGQSGGLFAWEEEPFRSVEEAFRAMGERDIFSGPAGSLPPAERLSYTPEDYRAGVRMRFLLNDSLASLSLLRHGHPGAFLSGTLDMFRAREALYAQDDPAPFWAYLRGALRRR